ncbi:hypothetical protein OG257_26580 [Streptomyces sp. NBC_00683]|uniref:hypothetical protein n=1 Tax=Streptomyces sp. NBC_00683 TaxID=2903670 RepID=UPI002E34CBC6|nr:hypothetical protein [Streptomyces sp. NBC_00683]
MSDQSFTAPIAPLAAGGIEFILSKDLEDDWLSESIPDIDFLCAVLDGQSESIPAVTYLEIGVALGREIPVLLVTNSPRNIPLALAGLQRVEVELANREAISQHIEQFAEKLRARRGRHTKGKSTSTASRVAVDFNGRLDRLSGGSIKALGGGSYATGRFGWEYEKLIQDVFAGAGTVSALSQPGAPDGGFDLAVWVDGASEVLGGPILVQCKIGEKIRPGVLRKDAEKLTDVMYMRSVNFGLIVYHDLAGSNELHSFHPRLPIWALSARELIDAVEAGSLNRIIVARRNELMHREGRRDSH